MLGERGQVTIFTEMQEILHMQGVDAIFRVVLDELVRNERGLVRVGGSQAIEGETFSTCTQKLLVVDHPVK